MEDGLESSRVTLYDFSEKTAKKKELDSCSCLYTYKQPNGEFIIIASKDKAIEYSIKNHCFVEIFTEKENLVYITTDCFYSNGIFIINK
jgi:hypothetical protein